MGFASSGIAIYQFASQLFGNPDEKTTEILAKLDEIGTRLSNIQKALTDLEVMIVSTSEKTTGELIDTALAKSRAAIITASAHHFSPNDPALQEAFGPALQDSQEAAYTFNDLEGWFWKIIFREETLFGDDLIATVFPAGVNPSSPPPYIFCYVAALPGYLEAITSWIFVLVEANELGNSLRMQATRATFLALSLPEDFKL